MFGAVPSNVYSVITTAHVCLTIFFLCSEVVTPTTAEIEKLKIYFPIEESK